MQVSSPRRVWVVIHNFKSHDMFVPQWAKEGNPKLIGIFSSRAEAKKHIRPGMDDSIESFVVGQIKKAK